MAMDVAAGRPTRSGCGIDSEAGWISGAFGITKVTSPGAGGSASRKSRARQCGRNSMPQRRRRTAARRRQRSAIALGETDVWEEPVRGIRLSPDARVRRPWAARHRGRDSRTGAIREVLPHKSRQGDRCGVRCRAPADGNTLQCVCELQRRWFGQSGRGLYRNQDLCRKP